MKLPIVDQVLSFVRKGGPAQRRTGDRDERLRVGFEMAPVGVALASPDGHWLAVNERFRALIGYTREELARISFTSITHPDDAKRETALVRKVMVGELESYRLEKRVMQKKGRYHTVEVLATVARTPAGEPDFFIYVADEPRGSTKAEHTRDGDRFLGAVIDQLADLAILRTDDKGTITGWNAGAEHLFGYKREEMLGKNRRLLFRDPDSWEGKPTRQLQSVADSGRLEFEDWRVTKSGSHLWVHTAITPFRPDGEVRGYLEVITPPAVPKEIDMSKLPASAEAKRTIEDLRGELDQAARREESLREALEVVRVMGEETMNELKIMTFALRKEIDRRKVVEDELRAANERVERLVADAEVVMSFPEPEPIIEEEEVVMELPPSREWRSVGGTTLDLLVSLGDEQRSGTLVLKSGESEKEFFFDRGKLFSCASNEPSQFLTHRLLALGWISEDQRQRALEIKQASQLALGRILLLLGAVSEDQLVDVMRAKMAEELAATADWSDARYVFMDDVVPSLQLVPLRVDPTELRPPPALVASSKSRKYHRPDCNAVKRLSDAARVLFATEESALADGYAACRLCFR